MTAGHVMLCERKRIGAGDRGADDRDVRRDRGKPARVDGAEGHVERHHGRQRPARRCLRDRADARRARAGSAELVHRQLPGDHQVGLLAAIRQGHVHPGPSRRSTRQGKARRRRWPGFGRAPIPVPPGSA